ncbi:MAG: response regulator [Defluviitaleaceae bacterium]|nr:response regulator [Defluviitaleaceae bacterium]
MRITSLIKILIVLFGFLAAVSVFYSFLAMQAKDVVVKAHETKHKLTSAVYQFNEASSLMTRYARVHAARAYSSTEATEFYTLYWNLRNYDTRIEDTLQTFIESGTPQFELDMLEHAMYLSYRLRVMEEQSFEAFANGNTSLSMHLMFGMVYKSYINPLADVMRDLTSAMYTRTQYLVSDAEMRANAYGTLSFAAIFLLAISSVIGTIVLLREVNASSTRERDAEEVNNALLSSLPMFLEFWDENRNFIDCSSQTLKIFGLSTKEEYIQRNLDFQPLRQPCGTPSDEKIWQYVGKALQDGTANCSWTSILPNGEPLITDTTFTCIKLRDKSIVVAYNHDMTSVNTAIDKERETYELATTIIDSSPFVISLWSEDFSILGASKQVVETFGVAEKDQYINHFFDLSPEFQPCGTSSRQKVAEYFMEAFKKGYTRFEWMHKSIDGTPLPMEITVVHCKRKDTDMLVSYAVDLREIQASAAKEREAHELTQTLLYSAPFVITMWDDSHRLISASKQAVEMFGLSANDPHIDLFHDFSPEIQPCGTPSEEKALLYMMEAIKNGRARFEWMHQTTTGELLPVETTLVRFKSHERDMLVSYITDLRAVKSAMAKISEAEERANLLIEALPISCLLLDARYTAVGCNQAALNLFMTMPGKSISDYLDDHGLSDNCDAHCKNCPNRGHNTCHARRYFLGNFLRTFPGYEDDPIYVAKLVEYNCRLALEFGVCTFEVDHITFYGKEIPCEVTMIPVHYQSETGFAIYLRDQREEKRREIAEEESRAKTRFLARMSHEIRTPMNAILGISEIQLQKQGHPSDIEESFLRIHNSSNQLLAIINDILDLSKVEAGKMEIFPTVYETASLIVDTVQLNLMQVGSKDIEFKLFVDEALPTHFIGDELRIKQILTNFLSNAFKYTDRGQVSLGFSVEDIKFDGYDQLLIIHVEDTGQGMTEEQVNSLFEAEFTRFNTNANRAIEGSGLGMNIAHQLIKMMHGDVHAQSEVGMGSSFTIRIPQRRHGDEILGREVSGNLKDLKLTQRILKDAAKICHEPMPYGRVLVADDVESNLFVIKGLLMPYKIAVETVTSGAEAIAKIEAGNVYDIVFMDHMMPEMDGLEATKAIRESGYNHPIIALTANTVSGAVELFMNNGFSGFISKPIDINRLNSYLEYFVRDKQPPEVVEAARVSAQSAQNALDEEQFSEAASREKLLKYFAADATKAVDLLETILSQPQLDAVGFKAYSIQTHALKSALHNIGHGELSNAAHNLERAGLAYDTDTVRALTPGFLDSLRQVIEEVSPPKKASVSPPGNTPDHAAIRGHMLTLQAACEAYDISAADGTLGTLKQMNVSAQTQAILDEIESLILFGDFEEAAVLAQGGVSEP